MTTKKKFSTDNVNPLKADAELSMMLKKLSKIGKYKTFQRWKTKFLECLEPYLYEEGIGPAEEAGVHFDRMLTKFVKAADKVTNHVNNGELGNERKTVKASLALNEMCLQLTEVIETLQTLIPSTSKEEKQKGFTKFHLGAALIRQGFHQYVSMTASQEAIAAFSDQLKDVADRQQLELFEYYNLWVERFCAVLADLGMYDIMMKCIEFAEAPEEEESSDEEDIHIEIEVSTPEGLKRLRLELDPRETIGNIKDAISQDIGIAPEKQVMKFKGNELNDNDASLKKAGIVNGSKLAVEAFTIPITVNTCYGETIPLKVDPDVFISDIKRMVEEKSGIAAPNQKLYHNGQELDNDLNKACDYGIEADAVLDMEPKTINVKVEMPNGSTIQLDLSPNDTDGDIKSKIENATGMAVPRQVLKTNGAEMPCGVKVKDIGVKNGATLQVEVFKVPITVNTHDGKTFDTMIDPSVYLSDLKRQLEPESGVPAQNQRLSMDGQDLTEDSMKAEDYSIKAGSVLDLEPNVITLLAEMPPAIGKPAAAVELQISPSATPNDVKKMIQQKTGMQIPSQILKFEAKEMPDNEPLKSIGVKDGSTVQVNTLRVPVTVKTYDGKTIQTLVDPTMPVKELKQQLEKESGVPATNQKLFKGKNELAGDTKQVADYGIDEGDELYLEPKVMTVQVKMPHGDTCSIEVSPANTSDDIKEKVEAKTGMSCARQVLKKEGAELPSGQSAREMGLHDGDNLAVDVFTLPVTVRTMDGEKHKVLIDPSQTIGDIKEQLSNDLGLPANNQNLFLNGSILDDDKKSARDCGIEAGSELDSEPKQIRITVSVPDGSTITLFVKPSDTAGDIKTSVEETTGLAAKRQLLKGKLKNKDWLLPVSSTVRALGIRDGAELSVEIYKIPIVVQTLDGETKYDLEIEPSAPLNVAKQQLQSLSGIDHSKIVLYFHEEEMKDPKQTVEDYGCKAHSLLTMDSLMDFIVFVDIKCGTLFAMDREETIKKQALTAREGNKLDFVECSRDGASRDKILAALKGSPTLGFAPQVVVEKMDIEDYDIEEAENVKNLWGVSLKKREKNKKGEEFLFIDPKTGACGELSRKKYIDMGFITPVTSKNGSLTLSEAETDTMSYDKYIHDIRAVFGVKSAI